MVLLRIIVGLAVWAAALFGALQFAAASNQADHGHDAISICGPWGCGPPLQALVGWHGFCLIFVMAPVALAFQFISPVRLRQIGVGVSVVGLGGLMALEIWENMTWTGGQFEYIWQRYLFFVATQTSIPVMPVTFAGIAMWVGGSARSRRQAGIAELECKIDIGDKPPSSQPIEQVL